MRILFIEDEPESIQTVIDVIQEDMDRTEIAVIDFGDAEDKLQDFRPHLVILDLLQGSTSDADPVGLNTFDFIWDKHFCPIGVYSAREELFDDSRQQHPFVKKIQKGASSEQKVLDRVKELYPHIKALQRTEREVAACLSIVMRVVAPQV